jgi:hypothetical protein
MNDADPKPTHPAPIPLSRLRIAAVLLFAFLNLGVFFLRAASVRHQGRLFFTNGGDALVLYPVWKVMHHLPAYGWPLAYPFTLSLYNYLFYYAYGIFLRLIHAPDAATITRGGLLTLFFVLLGAAAQWSVVRRYLSLRGAGSALAFLFALSLWVCTSLVGSWPFTVRPDLAAVALVMCALAVVLNRSGLNHPELARPSFTYLCAGVLFYLAWSFKQSDVLALAAVCVYLLLDRQWKAFAQLAGVFALLAALTLFVGSPAYRYNTLTAPAVSAFSLAHLLDIAPKYLAANLYWVLAPLALISSSGVKSLDGTGSLGGIRSLDRTLRLLCMVLLFGLVFGVAAMDKVGALDNYLFEALAAGSTLLILAAWKAPGKLVTALILFGCIQPAYQVLAMPSGTEHPHRLGIVRLATPRQYDQAVALRDRLAVMPKPLFTTSALFSLPWFSSNGQAPALVVDHIYHDATRSQCANGCVEGMLARGEIPTVMIHSTGDDNYRASLNPHYRAVAEMPYLGTNWTLYSYDPANTAATPPFH